MNNLKLTNGKRAIKSSEEQFAVQEQTVQYVQKKIIIRLFVILREKNIISVPDDFHSLFIDRIKMLDGTVSSPANQTNVNLPK